MPSSPNTATGGLASAPAAAAKVLTGTTGTRVAALTERKSACLASMAAVIIGAGGFRVAGGKGGGVDAWRAFDWKGSCESLTPVDFGNGQRLKVPWLSGDDGVWWLIVVM